MKKPFLISMIDFYAKADASVNPSIQFELKDTDGLLNKFDEK